MTNTVYIKTAKEVLNEVRTELQAYSDESFSDKIRLFQSGDVEEAFESALESRVYSHAVKVVEKHIEALQND